MKHVVLLTATVRPLTTARLRLVDPQARLEQYVRSIRSWVNLSGSTPIEVVVAENSGDRLETLAAALGDHGRLIHVPDTVADPGEGKGPGEARMVDEALAQLSLDDDVLVTKCTGRLFVTNFAAAVWLGRPGIQADLKSDFRAVDSRTFTAPVRVFNRNLRGMAAEIDERHGVNIEHVLRRRVLLALADGEPWLGWRRLPRFVGESGSSRAPYESIPSIARRLAHSGFRACALRRAITL